MFYPTSDPVPGVYGGGGEQTGGHSTMCGTSRNLHKCFITKDLSLIPTLLRKIYPDVSPPTIFFSFGFNFFLSAFIFSFLVHSFFPFGIHFFWHIPTFFLLAFLFSFLHSFVSFLHSFDSSIFLCWIGIKVGAFQK